MADEENGLEALGQHPSPLTQMARRRHSMPMLPSTFLKFREMQSCSLINAVHGSISDEDEDYLDTDANQTKTDLWEPGNNFFKSFGRSNWQPVIPSGVSSAEAAREAFWNATSKESRENNDPSQVAVTNSSAAHSSLNFAVGGPVGCAVPNGTNRKRRKEIRNINKKLKLISFLEERISKGEKLSDEDRAKLQYKSSLEARLDELANCIFGPASAPLPTLSSTTSTSSSSLSVSIKNNNSVSVSTSSTSSTSSNLSSNSAAFTSLSNSLPSLPAHIPPDHPTSHSLPLPTLASNSKPFIPSQVSKFGSSIGSTSSSLINIKTPSSSTPNPVIITENSKIDPDSDPVYQISQLCRRHHWVYQFSPVVGNTYIGFNCKCIVGSLIFPDGWGLTKEDSVRSAAQQALNAISYVREGNENDQQGDQPEEIDEFYGEGRERVRKSAYCRHFKARGWCSFGNNCRFIHGALVGLEDYTPTASSSAMNTYLPLNGAEMAGDGMEIAGKLASMVHGGDVEIEVERENLEIIECISDEPPLGEAEMRASIETETGIGDVLTIIQEKFKKLEHENSNLKTENEKLLQEIKELKNKLSATS